MEKLDQVCKVRWQSDELFQASQEYGVVAACCDEQIKPTAVCSASWQDANTAGSITTTFGALTRLIDDYDSMARKEMVTAAREKANT